MLPFTKWSSRSYAWWKIVWEIGTSARVNSGVMSHDRFSHKYCNVLSPYIYIYNTLFIYLQYMYPNGSCPFLACKGSKIISIWCRENIRKQKTELLQVLQKRWTWHLKKGWLEDYIGFRDGLSLLVPGSLSDISLAWVLRKMIFWLPSWWNMLVPRSVGRCSLCVQQ